MQSMYHDTKNNDKTFYCKCIIIATIEVNSRMQRMRFNIQHAINHALINLINRNQNNKKTLNY